MKKRTKIIILSVMIVLLGVTGYLNIMLNNSIKETNTTITTTSYFTSFRNDKESSRNQELLYYDAIIDSPNSTSEAVKAAEDAKMELIAVMKMEVAIEGLIKLQGFDECVVSIVNDKVNVVVKAKELTEPEAAMIWTTVIEQMEKSPDFVGNISIYYVD